MTEEKYKKLDKYFQEEMSSKEKDHFLSELKNDDELREEFNLRRLTAAALYKAELMKFKQQVLQGQMKEDSALDHSNQPAPTGRVINLRLRPMLMRLTKIAAVLVLAFTAWWLWPESEPSHEGVENGFSVLKETSLPIQMVEINNGQSVRIETGRSLTVKVLKNNLPEAVAVLDGNSLNLFIPTENSPSNIQLVELGSIADKTLFLGMDNKWYRLSTDNPREQLLIEEKDETILNALK